MRKQYTTSALFNNLPQEAREAISAHYAALGRRGAKKISDATRKAAGIKGYKSRMISILKNRGIPIPQVLKDPTPTPLTEDAKKIIEEVKSEFGVPRGCGHPLTPPVKQPEPTTPS